ncbi:hypothetical protein M3685_10995 [Heyndrickxia oleronia]|uniref:hypothetical protein n=1 Tax=Heyndrickxia oleronia TaxID=38875 RepID=UPI00203A9004|nr:hypothetical protein [Heyndrickxia oleronia]MCM3454471.1 hypothetical protein [Heyndrickxia oleronia]
MQLVNCDQCKKNFPVQPKEKKHGQGIKETYFVCTHCKTRYTAYVTDQEVRRMQSQIQKLEQEIITLKMNASKRMDELKEQIST